MKNSIKYFIFITFLISISSFSQNENLDSTNRLSDFVITWDTTKKGISNNSSIIIPVVSGVYYYNVDWNNDGVFEEKQLENSVTHDFKKPEIYTIIINGLFPHFSFKNEGDKLKLIEINQWGNQQWVSVNGMF